jgi:hypothetical protein
MFNRIHEANTVVTDHVADNASPQREYSRNQQYSLIEIHWQSGQLKQKNSHHNTLYRPCEHRSLQPLSSARAKRRSHVDGVGVLANAAEVLVSSLATSVDLFGVDAVLGVEVLHFAVGEDSVEAAIELEVVAELGEKGEALFLTRKLEKVGTLAHDSSSACGHLEDALLLRVPRNHVELLNLRVRLDPYSTNMQNKKNNLHFFHSATVHEHLAMLATWRS